MMLEQEPRAFWQPKSLNSKYLWPLCVVIAAMLIALEMLNYVSNSNGGLASTDENMHYLWTYGPTPSK